jgi:tRNA 5-methylaminomethyl-2-thiouridine biosynthesis bifunctional protein
LQRIEPARVVLDSSGAPYNPDYGDVYASRDGALAQARHVFLRGSDLPARWQGRDQFVIVETGFGLGVNFLATWQAWRDDPVRPRRLHFVSVERHPVDAATLLRFAPAELAPLARQIAAAWPPALAGLHRRVFETDAVVLTLGFGAADDLLPQLVAGADAFFLDGFAPDRNPDLWTPRVMRTLARLARDGATVATWSTARSVRDGLSAAGFDVAPDAGFGRKRQMLRGRFAPRWRVRRADPPVPMDGERSAIVIGAGLAGANATRALIQRGWRVQVLERGARVAGGASALPWGLLHPQITSDDNDMARLVRVGFFMARAVLAQFAPAGRWQHAPLWRSHGSFVQARDAREAARWRTLAQALDLPGEFVQFHSADEAEHLTGVAPQRDGWWFPHAASVAAPALCAALIEHPCVTLRTACAVARIRSRDGCWFAEDDRDVTLAAAPVCIVANALDAPRLLGLEHAHVRPVRGQLSMVSAPALASLRAAVSGGGTLVPMDDGTVAVGATYEFDADTSPVDALRVHEGNLQRLLRLLASPVAAMPSGLFDAVRCVARDRLPLAGAVADEGSALHDAPALRGAHLLDLPRCPGLYASFAFGSRGLALAPLAAELIAAQIEGEPWPLERSLAARLDVARFLLRAVRRTPRQ